MLGRLASRIATLLMGKHKPTYLDNVFTGDPIVVINARHFSLTGRKARTKVYVRHTGRPGGRKEIPIARLLRLRPEDPLRLAIKRMLPPNKLRDVRLSHLKIYPDAEHPHESQNPDPVPSVEESEPLRKGCRPAFHDLAVWWLDEIRIVPDRVLDQVVTETRHELFPSGERKTEGLAVALGLPEPHKSVITRFTNTKDKNDTAACYQYVRAAEDQREQFNQTYPVIVPPTLQT